MRSYNLTPTAELIMEVLVARWRLGETTWSFPKRLSSQTRWLETIGLVQRTNTDVAEQITLKLTEKARKELLSDAYTPAPKWSDTALWRAGRQHMGIMPQEGTMFEDRKVACRGCGHPYEHSPFDGMEASKLREEQRQHIADVLLALVTENKVLAHNHMTRDIKEPGKCPACDQYHADHPEEWRNDPSYVAYEDGKQ